MAVKIKSKDTPPKKPHTVFDDLRAAGDSIAQNWGHGAQQIADASDAVGGYFGLRHSQPGDISLTGLFRTLGQNYKPPATTTPGVKGTATVKDAGGFGKKLQGQPAPKTLADYLAEASSLLSQSGAGPTDYTGIENMLKDQALNSNAKLAAMYRQLQGSFASDAPTIQSQYDTAASGINQNADQAAGNINDAYQASRDAQTQQLAALGIGDAAAVLAANGGNAAADQAHANSSVRQNQAVNADRATQNKASALNYNTNIGNAASLAGGEAQSKIAQQLQSALGSLAQQEAQSKSSSGTSALNLAMQLQGADQNSDSSLAKFMYQQQQDAAKSQQSMTNSQRQTYLSLLKQYSGDDTKAAQAFQLMQKAGLV